MPEKSETVFGKGNAGHIWKSMLAEQIGQQIAKAGGVGIAKMMDKAHPASSPPAKPSTPHRSCDGHAARRPQTP